MERAKYAPPTRTRTGCAENEKASSVLSLIPTTREYSADAGSALISLTIRRSVSASVTTILVAVGSKLSHLNRRTGSLVLIRIKTAASVWAWPPQKIHDRS